jgi:hypothetical protein
MLSMDLRNRLLESARTTQPRREAVALPTGDTAYVVEMTAADRDRFDAMLSSPNRRNLRASFVANSLRDEEGRRIFSNEDITALSQAPTSWLEPLADAAVLINKLAPDVAEALAKN